MKKLERLILVVRGEDIKAAETAIKDVPEGVMGEVQMKVYYDASSDRCTFKPDKSDSFSGPLEVPAGLDGKVNIYSSEGQGTRGKVAFSHLGHEYVIDPNRD